MLRASRWHPHVAPRRRGRDDGGVGDGGLRAGGGRAGVLHLAAPSAAPAPGPLGPIVGGPELHGTNNLLGGHVGDVQHFGVIRLAVLVPRALAAEAVPLAEAPLLRPRVAPPRLRLHRHLRAPGQHLHPAAGARRSPSGVPCTRHGLRDLCGVRSRLWLGVLGSSVWRRLRLGGLNRSSRLVLVARLAPLVIGVVACLRPPAPRPLLLARVVALALHFKACATPAACMLLGAQGHGRDVRRDHHRLANGASKKQRMEESLHRSPHRVENRKDYDEQIKKT
mmetsp:Transcript_127006/g.344845  ORF Transcript_127006/g.344845 Transcript_127006/m.344845 type:complete len:280 (-) Transcript_127006:8-847(-)